MSQPHLARSTTAVLNRATLLLFMSLLAGCATTPTAPKNPANLCSVFVENRDWYVKALRAERRWGAPVPVQMAIINQESSFVDDARPPRYRFLGILPLWRTSSAYGYAQAKDETWSWYKTKTGNDGADRDEFGDAADFIGWYLHQSFVSLGLSKRDAYSQYLAYHEGHGGFKRKSYVAKPWLQKAAARVAATAERYRKQLAACRLR